MYFYSEAVKGCAQKSFVTGTTQRCANGTETHKHQEVGGCSFYALGHSRTSTHEDVCQTECSAWLELSFFCLNAPAGIFRFASDTCRFVLSILLERACRHLSQGSRCLSACTPQALCISPEQGSRRLALCLSGDQQEGRSPRPPLRGLMPPLGGSRRRAVRPCGWWHASAPRRPGLCLSGDQQEGRSPPGGSRRRAVRSCGQ